jgi:hypothetical protein
MTTNTIEDPRSNTGSAPASEPPTTCKTEPRLAVPPASSELDLESRINVRRAELTVKLGELEAVIHLVATEARDKLKARLSDLARLLRWGRRRRLGESHRQREAQARTLAR